MSFKYGTVIAQLEVVMHDAYRVAPHADAFCDAGHHDWLAVHGDRLCGKCFTSEMNLLRRRIAQLEGQLALRQAAVAAVQRQQRRPR